MNMTKQFFDRHGITFKVERNGIITSSSVGLPNHESATQRAYIGMPKDADVSIGDWLINPSNERFYVCDKISDYAFGEFQQYKLFYLTETERAHQQASAASAVFNIENAYGSVIGTQASVIMNYQTTLQELHDQVAKSDSPDKEQLEKILSTLDLIVDGSIPMQKGLLSKFSAVMERNSWITGSIASALLSWLTAQIV